MQAVLKMIRFMFNLAWRGAIVYVIFMLMVWILMGIHPRETWGKTYSRVAGVGHWITGFTSDVADAGAGLHKMGERHLNEAKDRFHGIDPYEKYNNQLSQDMQQAQ